MKINKDGIIFAILNSIKDCYPLDSDIIIKLREGLNRLSLNNLKTLSLLTTLTRITDQSNR